MYEQALKLINNEDNIIRKIILEQAIKFFNKNKVATESAIKMEVIRTMPERYSKNCFVLDPVSIQRLVADYYMGLGKSNIVSKIILNIHEVSEEDFEKLLIKTNILSGAVSSDNSSIYEFIPSKNKLGFDEMTINITTLSFYIPNNFVARNLNNITLGTLDVKPTPNSKMQHIEFNGNADVFEFCDSRADYITDKFENFSMELIKAQNLHYAKDLYTWIELGNPDVSFETVFEISDNTQFTKSSIDILTDLRAKYSK